MRIGIICAADRELAPFLPLIEKEKISNKAMLTFHEGTIEGVEVVAVMCGACKVNAALTAQLLIDTYQVEAIINSGTAGGMDQSLNIFDTVISTEAAYHDVEEWILKGFHPYLETVFFKAGEELLSTAHKVVEEDSFEQNVLFGRMVTGEAFIEDENRDEINEVFHPLSVDMETTAIAHVCHVNGIPFIAVRSISDTADHSGIGTFDENCPKASLKSMEFILAMLRKSIDKQF